MNKYIAQIYKFQLDLNIKLGSKAKKGEIIDKKSRQAYNRTGFIFNLSI